MKIKIMDGNLYVNGQYIPAEYVGFEATSEGHAVLHIGVADPKAEFTIDDVDIHVSPPDPRPAIANFIKHLPPGMIESASLDACGLGDNNVFANALQVIAELVERAEIGGIEDDHQHECPDEGVEDFDAGSYYDQHSGD